METSVEELAEQSGAFQIPVARGIAMACFILARCRQLGQALSKNGDLAQTYFQRVSMHCNSNTNYHHKFYPQANKFDKVTVADLHTQMVYGKI